MPVPPYFAWQALHGQGWPATAEQEKALVEDLRRAAGADQTPDTGDVPRRTAVTALLNVLRCGTSYPQLRAALPAIDPAELLHAHTYLTERLTDARTHWAHLIAHPGTRAFTGHADAAARILPVPVHRIEVALHNLTDEHRIARSTAAVAAEVRRITHAATNIEAKLHGREPGSATGLALGRSLHDAAEPGVWTHPYFLPVRVGQLSTTRVRDLYTPETADAR